MEIGLRWFAGILLVPAFSGAAIGIGLVNAGSEMGIVGAVAGLMTLSTYVGFRLGIMAIRQRVVDERQPKHEEVST